MAYEAELDFERPLLELERKIEELKGVQDRGGLNIKTELAGLETRAEELKKSIYSNLTPWQRVLVARHPKRPYALDLIGMILSDFVEMHGDRAFGDDPAVVCGLAHLDGRPVVVIGQQKGRDVKENLIRNFGMMHPEGYRKALRFLRMAEKFRRPVITMIDTTGAYPGIGAEERGQSEAIARNLAEMSLLKTPIISVVIGEGGSGGALGIGVADRILMMENTTYSVISPEACAAILWRNARHAPEAAKTLHMTAKDLLGFGIIDEIVPEPPGGAHRDPVSAAATLKASLSRNLKELDAMTVDEMVEKRYGKFRSIGQFIEVAPEA